MNPENEPQGMRAIIVSPESKGEGVYTLIAEDGELLAQHFCSEAGFAEDDLFRNRPKRKEKFDAKGISSFVWLEDSGLTLEEVLKRNHEFYEVNKGGDGETAEA